MTSLFKRNNLKSSLKFHLFVMIFHLWIIHLLTLKVNGPLWWRSGSVKQLGVVDMIKYLPSIVNHTVESNGPVCYVYSQ